MSEQMFSISSFQSGVNEYIAEGLLKPYEAMVAKNCLIQDGSLTTKPVPILKSQGGSTSVINSLMAYYSDTSNELVTGEDNVLYKGTTKIGDIQGVKLDYINFQYKSKSTMIMCSKDDRTKMYQGVDSTILLKNRWIRYNEDGTIDKYIDAEGKEFATEEEIKTLAPTGNFIELYYDRLWISGNKEHKDRIYFSTASINGADIEDWTYPIDEAEANQHGGFLDVRSYDGTKIIGMKALFNTIVVFKNKSAYKIFGNAPENFQLIEMFNCNGAIADKTICVGNNGAYFLNSDGIYYYDGTNTNLISQKVSKTLSKMNKSYADKSVGIYYDNVYYVAIPTGDSTVNNTLIRFNVVGNSFMVYDIGNITDFLEFDDEILYSSGSNIMKLDNTSSECLPLLWETPNFDFGKKNSRKMSTYMYFRGSGEGIVRFTLKTDVKEKVLEVQLTGEEKLYKKKLKNKGRMFKLKIENLNNKSIKITQPQLLCEIDED